MKIKTKFNFDEKVYFVRTPRGFNSDFSKIISGTIERVYVTSKAIRYGISAPGIWYKDVFEEVIFRTKKKAEKYLAKQIIKDRQ